MTKVGALAAIALIAQWSMGCQDNSVRTDPATQAGEQVSAAPGNRSDKPATAVPPSSSHGTLATSSVATTDGLEPTTPTPEPDDSASLLSGLILAKRPSNHPPRFGAKTTIYDRSNPAFHQLQSAQEALQHFPADSQGNIDWVDALANGLISPRSNLANSGQMQLRDDAVIMRNTLDMPWVRFPHRQHTEWLACSNCHPRLFEEKAGSNEITMDNIMRGRQCGVCHDRVAFSIFACERCHSVLHPGSPRAWW